MKQKIKFAIPPNETKNKVANLGHCERLWQTLGQLVLQYSDVQACIVQGSRELGAKTNHRYLGPDLQSHRVLSAPVHQNF